MKDELVLKWGTIKQYDLFSEAAKKASDAYQKAPGNYSLPHKETDEQKKLLCALIDSLNADFVFLSWITNMLLKKELNNM